MDFGKDTDGSRWFRIPCANWKDYPVELEENTCLREISLLADVSQEGVDQVVGAIRSVPLNGRGGKTCF